MKKLIFLFIFFFIMGCTTQVNITSSFIKDKGNISVHFCSTQNCSEILTNFLNSSQQSIQCAFYDLDLEKPITVLKNKNAQLVIDEDNPLNLTSTKIAEHYGLMHNKFCIVDNKKIITGSFNPTFNGAYKNDNNIVIINSPLLAHNYQQEFNELWQGIYQGGEKTTTTQIIINKTPIQNYFCPEDNCISKIKQELEKAQSSIYFMTFSFTHPSITNTLLLKHQENITVKGIFEKFQAGSQHSAYHVLSYQGPDVTKDINPNYLHHKVFIIDNQTVITGSLNPSKNGNNYNDENILIINSKEIAHLYLEEFERLTS